MEDLRPWLHAGSDAVAEGRLTALPSSCPISEGTMKKGKLLSQPFFFTSKESSS